MELILIRDDRLKIMLSEEDLKEYSLDCDNIDYDNTETRHAFWSILDKAKRKTGFDAASSKVLVQVYTSKSGGCEMYVTKVKENDDANGDIRNKELSLIGCGNTDPCIIFEFDCADNLISVCSVLRSSGFGKKSSVYTDRNGRYFLKISSAGCDELESRFPFIGEYADRTFTPIISRNNRKLCTSDNNNKSDVFSSAMAMAYINEHCSLISESAIDDFAPLCRK